MKFAAGYAWHIWQTAKHKALVAHYLRRYAEVVPEHRGALLRRGLLHDLSKFRPDEARGFATTIFDLKRTEYGSAEYGEALDLIAPSIALHYARNPHHPEHYRQGYYGMSQLDRIEMVADWCAAVRRHEGDPREGLRISIEKNKERFGYSGKDAAWISKTAEQMGAL